MDLQTYANAQSPLHVNKTLTSLAQRMDNHERIRM